MATSTLSQASLQRLRCARQHLWSDNDDIWRGKVRRDGIKVYENTAHCTRRGCRRVRKIQISQRTYDKLSTQYTGEQEKLGRVLHRDIYHEMITRQEQM